MECSLVQLQCPKIVKDIRKSTTESENIFEQRRNFLKLFHKFYRVHSPLEKIFCYPRAGIFKNFKIYLMNFVIFQLMPTVKFHVANFLVLHAQLSTIEK